MSIKSRIATRALKFLPKNMLRSAGSAVSSLGRGAVRLPGRAIRAVGKGALIGAGANAVMGGDSGAGQQVGGFGQLAGANIAANDSNGGMGGNPASGMPVAQSASNNGKNTTVNRNALESSSENMNDVERELVQIKEELKEINAKTVPPETFQKAGNADEGSIKDMFSAGKGDSKKKNAMVGGIKGAAGMAALVAGISLLSDKASAGNALLEEVRDKEPLRDEEGRLQNPDGSRIDFMTGNGESNPLADNLGTAQVVSGVAKAATAAGAGTLLNAAGGKKVVEIAGRTSVAAIAKGTGGEVAANAARGLKTNSAGRLTAMAGSGSTGYAKAGTKPVTKAAMKLAVGKVLAAKAAVASAKAIPFLGSIVGIGSSIWRGIKGDFVGAGLDLAGAAGSLSGAGTPVALATMTANMARDVYKSIDWNGDGNTHFPLEEPDGPDGESGTSIATRRMSELSGEVATQLGEWLSNLGSEDSDTATALQAGDNPVADGASQVSPDDSPVMFDDAGNPVPASSVTGVGPNGQTTTNTTGTRGANTNNLSSQTDAVNDTSAGSGGGAPIIIQSGGAPVAPVVSVSPPVVNVITGDEMKSTALGSARFSNGV